MKLPVLLLAYNRPRETKIIIDYLIKLKVKKIFISIDGPKETENDQLGSKEIMKIIKSYKGKNLRINKLSRNFGCKTAVEKGIRWFFKYVEKGIILEDDCIPTKSFFLFCEKLLIKYKNTKVKVISGNNFLNNKIKIKEHYYFSRFNHCWGWATWRNAWNVYDSRMKNWNKLKKSEKWITFFNNEIDRKYWEKIFNLSEKNYFDSWAYPWLYSIWYNSGYTVIPKYNLVKNVGFYGTHNSFNSNLNFRVKKLEKKFKHPRKIEFFEIADNYVMKNFFKPKNLLWPSRLLYLFKMFIFNPFYFTKISFRKLKKKIYAIS